ncbi:hypothetical protein B9Z55_000032 [Caenorhabditis nigoni]|uniref:Secreted protein n=1 Tax=Caenorhabditis nigoni TaxID=1611254 RepID=A0A2G5VPD4_9PELO|nr:hypothetical protein B9Z55_000032 [Caenorhabditis nigoni]
MTVVLLYTFLLLLPTRPSIHNSSLTASTPQKGPIWNGRKKLGDQFYGPIHSLSPGEQKEQQKVPKRTAAAEAVKRAEDYCQVVSFLPRQMCFIH